MNNRLKVILKTSLAVVLFLCLTGGLVEAKTPLERKVDSLFMICSSGSIKYRDLVEPAQDSLAALGADVVPYLIEKFDTKAVRERWAVIFVLRKIGSPAVPDLLKALKSDDPLMVQRVASALGDIKDSTATEGLLAVCGAATWQVRDQAVGALGRIGDRRATGAVLTALIDSIGQVRKSAAVSAGQLTVEESVRPLVHMLGDDFYGARLSAYNSLTKLDTAAVINALGDSLSSANELLGNLGCSLLGQLGSGPAIELLRSQLSSTSAGRRGQAARALVKADPYDNCGYLKAYLPKETDRLVLLQIESARSAVADEK